MFRHRLQRRYKKVVLIPRIIGIDWGESLALIGGESLALIGGNHWH